MSASTAGENDDSPLEHKTIRIAVAVSVSFLVLVLFGMCHFGPRKARLRRQRARRAVQTRITVHSEQGLGQNAVDKIPMIKYHDHSSPSPHHHQISHVIWPGHARSQQADDDRATRPRTLGTRLWCMIRRGRREGDEEEPHMSPSTCSICTEDFCEGDKLRKLPFPNEQMIHQD
ncbi:hypothetical protein PG985_014299 [Apiospora marii]|uniref:Uncharacterized protein n=1 Tax=Apiospora marii TaxID=335849 RepID=A0ABR1R634_9PEZI